MELKKIFREVPDFPKPGINFIDITPLLNRPDAFRWTVDTLVQVYEGQRIDRVVAIESRGFLFGAAMALQLEAGLAPLRKPNKLPAAKYSYTYSLEYGQDTLEIHQDAIQEGDRVVIVDDLLATGGTARAAVELLKNFSCTIAGFSFVVELAFLEGRRKLEPVPVHSLVTYDA